VGIELAAVVFTIRVCIPLVVEDVNAIVADGVNVHVGVSVTPVIVVETEQVSVTEPLNPFAPVTVIACVPEPPRVEMEIVAVLLAGATLIPATPTVTVTEEDVLDA
jgi:hypothetical protein